MLRAKSPNIAPPQPLQMVPHANRRLTIGIRKTPEGTRLEARWAILAGEHFWTRRPYPPTMIIESFAFGGGTSPLFLFSFSPLPCTAVFWVF